MMKSCRLAVVLRQVLGALSFAALLVFAYSVVSFAASTTTYQAYLTAGSSNHISGCNVSTPTQESVSSWQSSCTSAFKTWAQQFSPGPGSCSWTYTSSGPAYSSDAGGTTSNTASAGSGCDSPVYDNESFTLSCPNGGVLSSSYPDWCVVNGQAPPNPTCQADKGKYVGEFNVAEPAAGSGSFNSYATNASNGCEIELDTLSLCISNGQPAGMLLCTVGGIYTGNQAPSSGEPTAGGSPSAANPSDTSCMEGAAVVCGSSNGTNTGPGQTGCGFVDGNPLCASQLPNSSCVSAVNGGTFCSANTPSPPSPNNGTYGTPATPTQTVTPGVGSPPTALGTPINYCNPTCVAGSTTKPVTIGTGTNYGSSTTPAPPAGTGQGCPAQECQLLTQIASATSSTAASAASIAGAATYIAAQFATTVSMPSTSTTNAQAPLITAIGSAPPSVSGPVTPDLSSLQSQLGGPCVPETWTIDGVSMPFNVCDAATIIQGLMQMLLYGVLVIYLWKRFLATGLFKRMDT